MESNNDIELKKRNNAIESFIIYFNKKEDCVGKKDGEIEMNSSKEEYIQLPLDFKLWIFKEKVISFTLEKTSDNIKACANQLTIGMNLQQLIQSLNYDPTVVKPKDFSSDLSWFKRWKQNPFPDGVLKFAFDYIFSIFIKAHDINQYHGIKTSYHPNELNLSNIKNDWEVLPRTPLYHIFDLFSNKEQGELITALLENFIRENEENKDQEHGINIGAFLDSIHVQESKGDFMLRSGVMDTEDTINGYHIFLFEYRSVKLKVRDIYEDDKKIIWKG